MCVVALLCSYRAENGWYVMFWLQQTALVSDDADDWRSCMVYAMATTNNHPGRCDCTDRGQGLGCGWRWCWLDTVGVVLDLNRYRWSASWIESFCTHPMRIVPCPVHLSMVRTQRFHRPCIHCIAGSADVRQWTTSTAMHCFA